jgi:hypothetical protein
MPLPLLAPLLYGLGALGGEESLRRVLRGTVPSQTDLAEQHMRTFDRARGLGELSAEEFKAGTLKGLFPISEGLDRLEERGSVYTGASMRMLLQANQDDLRTIAHRSPMSPVEVMANIRALSGVR